MAPANEARLRTHEAAAARGAAEQARGAAEQARKHGVQAPRPALRLIEGGAAVTVARRRPHLSTAAWQAIAGVTAVRLFTLAIGFASTYWLGARLSAARHLRPGDPLFDQHPFGFTLRAWRHWDAVWFLRIADHGYGLKRAAFFPLYPILVRYVGRVVGNTSLAGILVAVICLALAMVLLYRLVAEEFDQRVALWTVLLLSAAGTSFYFQAIYSESLFLLLTLASFSAARHGRWWAAGGAGLLAALTRSAGVVLLAPLLWMWVEQRRGAAIRLPGGPTSAALLTSRRARLPELGWLLLVPAGVGLFMAYTLVRFHDALLFVAAQHYWHRHMAVPTSAMYQGALAAKSSVTDIAAHPSLFFAVARPSWENQWITLGNLTAFLALLFAAGLFAACWRRLPAAYTVFAAASLLLPLLYPTHSTPLLSMPRFVLVVFPLFIALGVLLARRPVLRWAALAGMLAGLVVLTTMFANGMWVS
jgi:hypothetical protein